MPSGFVRICLAPSGFLSLCDVLMKGLSPSSLQLTEHLMLLACPSFYSVHGLVSLSGATLPRLSPLSGPQHGNDQAIMMLAGPGTTGAAAGQGCQGKH